MANFATEVLKPHLTEGALATAPALPAAIENALTFPPTKGPSVFSRLASGPLYRGDIVAMLAVVAPETLEKFAIASQKVTSKEAMAAVIRDSAVDPARKKVCNGSRRRFQLIYASTVPQVDLLTQTGCRLEPDHTTIKPHSNRPVESQPCAQNTPNTPSSQRLELTLVVGRTAMPGGKAAARSTGSAEKPWIGVRTCL